MAGKKEGNVRRSDEDWMEKGDTKMENEGVAGENVCSPKRQKKLRTKRPGKISRNGHGVEQEHCILRRYKSHCRVHASGSGRRDTVRDSGIKYQRGKVKDENREVSEFFSGTRH
jgi:hypothetical protein